MHKFNHCVINKNQALETILLTELMVTCRQGNEFYSQVVTDVEHQGLRNQFFGMAHLCADIASSLTDEAANTSQYSEHRPLAPNAEPAFISNSLLNCYYETPHKHSDFENRDFIEQLELAEQTYLSKLKKQITRIHNRPYARLLSAKVASMQIMHDRLKDLKNSL